MLNRTSLCSHSFLSVSLFLICLLVLFSPLEVFAGNFTVFGPQNYTRGSGSPEPVVFNFSVLNPETEYTLKITNGGLEDDQFELVSSSEFLLNGVEIVGPNEFNQNVSYIEKPITVNTANQFSVELRGKPGGGLTVEIVGLDNDPPTITALLDIQPNGAGWHNQDVTVSFSCDDAISGVAACSDSIIVNLEGAAQVITGTAIDHAGNSQTASVVINLDKTPPVLNSSTDPIPNANGWNNSDPTISFSATDALSGLVSVSPDVTVTTEGANQIITGTATDLADNIATLDVTVNLDKTAPIISATSSPLPNANGWNNTDVNVSFTGTDSLSGIDTLTPQITVTSEGANQLITGTAVDMAGNSSTASVTLNIDKTPPSLILTSPPDELATNQTVLSVTGTATDANTVSDVSVNGTSANLLGDDFELALALTEGANTVIVTATDIADNSTTQTRTVSVDSIAPVVTISSPANLSTSNLSTVSVTGTIDDPDATLEVNGVDATITGNTYAADITLGEGTRFITAVAQDPLGNTGTANISVTIDTTPPRVILNTPIDGATVYASPVTVTGMINDIVSGTVNGNNATVTVNGVPATVSNRGFMAENVSLNPGPNTITAVGTDTAGNQAQASITVNLDTSAQARINIISGNNQTGTIGAPLSQALVVELRDAQGNLMVNHPVTFNVIRNNGYFDGGPRKVTLNSDSLGRAQVTWTLGTYAGAGENRAEVTAMGISAKALFTATGVAGTAALIHPVNFSVFRGEAGNALPEPMQVIVSDEKGNPVQGVSVTFTVVNGDGLVNNQTQIDVLSNSDGKAHVTWVLGPEEGITNNKVEATFPNNPGLPVTFVASGVIPGNPEDTSFSGIVLSNTEEPIPGVEVSVLNTPLETQTDDQGQFRLTGVPVGAIHLIVDGTTATIPGTWPTLEFQVNTVSGRDNTVGMPIYLLPIDVQNAQTVSPSQSASLQVSNVAGFSLDIPAGSVTFRDGSQTGSVSVTQVHRDKVPMPPPNGLNPKLVFTIQPPGAVFDPPAPISYPNIDNRLPGEIVDLYSFDHDLGQWVGIGTGTVSQDGAFIVSDPGVGIIEGGWHFPAPPELISRKTISKIKCGGKTIEEVGWEVWIQESVSFLKQVDQHKNNYLKEVMDLSSFVDFEFINHAERTLADTCDTQKTIGGCFNPNNETIFIIVDDPLIAENNGPAFHVLLHELYHAAVYERKMDSNNDGVPDLGPIFDEDEDGAPDDIDPSFRIDGVTPRFDIHEGATIFGVKMNPVCQKLG
ncbi:MAG TPA: carboxypeptidase-like regulatory domain-containing protein [Nitrospiria bacterium]|jgi:hypothetical protein